MEGKVTIYSLAEELGMSPSMVSRALNRRGNVSPEKERIILEAAERHNFKLNRAASRLSKSRLKIGVLINHKSEHVTEELLAGIKNAYDKNADYKITLDTAVIKEYDPKKEVQACEKALFSFVEYDGVLVCGMGPAYFNDTLNRFYKENKNIVHVQSINENTGYLFASKHDERIASRMAAELLSYFTVRFGREKNRILLFTGDINTTLHRNARDTFAEACEDKGLELVESFDIREQKEYLKQSLPSIFEKYKDSVNGIYISSGNSLPLCEYLYKHGLKIPLIAFDIFEPLNDYIRNNTIWVSMFQNIVGQAENAFDGLVNYLVNNEKPAKTVYTDVVPVMKSNLSLYAKETE